MKSFFHFIFSKLKKINIEKSFRVLHQCILNVSGTKKNLLINDDFEYKNEEWEPISCLSDLLKAAVNHKTLELKDRKCSIDGKGYIKDNSLTVRTQKSENNWMCFFFKHQLEGSYIFEFNISIQSVFKEIQIAFKYGNLANRLRFMIRDNKDAVFEIINDGWFHKYLFAKPYSLKLGQKYHFKVTVADNKFGFYINGEEIFLIKQRFKIKTLGNGLCLILYNACGDINCEITDTSIVSSN